MKIRHTVTGVEYGVRLVWHVGAAHPSVFVRGIAEPIDPLYFAVVEALPQEIEALSPDWRTVAKGALRLD